MDIFETKLGVLSDALDKKLEFLKQILTITENQEAVLDSEPDALAELTDMLRQMNDEKQRLIDELLSSDRFFEHVFSEISGEFEARALEYKPLIAKLQKSIQEVTDMDVRIRMLEQKNRKTMKSPDANPLVKGKTDFTKASKAYMLKQYKKNNERED